MAVARGQAKSLGDRVYRQLASGIISGRYPAGAHLPSERALAEKLAVNRQVVREALRRLAQVGLVQVLHGDGTKVLDFREHGGLDVLAVLMDQAGTRNDSRSLWLPILELRSALAPEVVRHCTLRAKLTLRREVLTVAHAMERASTDEELCELEERFWDLVHEGADQIVFRLTYNAFKRCARPIRKDSCAWIASEVKRSGFRVPLARAIAAGQGERAEREVRQSMRAMLEAWAAKKPRKSAAKSIVTKVKRRVSRA